MSHSCDETYEVYNERNTKARKPHVCDACKRIIRPGDMYTRIGIVFDGEVENVKRCLGCQAAHEHLRTLAPGDMWPDEKLNCGEEYEEHWGGPPPEEIARIPFMTPDEMQREFAGKVGGR